MTLGKMCAVLAAMALMGVAAGAATAQSRWIVSGTLDAVDESTGIVEIDGNTLRMPRTARIKTESMVAGTWADVADREGEHVSALVVPGHPHPEIQTIVLADEIEDGDE